MTNSISRDPVVRPLVAISCPTIQEQSASEDQGSGLELRESGSRDERGESARPDGDGRGQPSLPRADGGKDAWLFLAGCFMIEALVWGFPFSYGIFQQYYTTHLPFSAQHNSPIASIGTTATGILYLGAPFVFIALQTYPLLRPPSCYVGLALIVVSLVTSSFATQVWHLILTQGVLYAIGGSLLYGPAILYMDEWFVRRKGLAFGLMYAGTGAAGAVVPLVMTWGLAKYRFATMLRVWAVVLLVLAGPLLYFVRPRIPVQRDGAGRRPASWSFLKGRMFWALQASNVLQGLGYFIPSIYLPTYASGLGLSPLASSTTVVLLNAMSVFGTIVLGFLVDRLHITTVILISTMGAALSVFLLWGMSSENSIGCLVAFLLVYGAFAGGFSSCYVGMGKEIMQSSPGSEIGTLLGLLSAGRGVGAMVSGPLSEVMFTESWGNAGSLGVDGKYGGLVIFTGVTALCGSVSFFGKQTGLV